MANILDFSFADTKPTKCNHKDKISLDCDSSLEQRCFEAKGASSRFMEAILKPIKCTSLRISIPYDYDDFNRCASLFKLHSEEWDIKKMKIGCGETWKKIAENWPHLMNLWDDGSKEKITQKLQEFRT
jgi:hypothetical protein